MSRVVTLIDAPQVFDGKLDAFEVHDDSGVATVAPNDRLISSYLLAIKPGQAPIEYGKRETGGTCSAEEISALTPSAARQPPNYGDDSEGLGYGTRDTMIYYDQHDYVVRTDGKLLLVKQITPEGGLQPLCSIAPRKTEMIVVRAEAPAICAARAKGTLRAAKWKPFTFPESLTYLSDYLGLMGFDRAEMTEADLAARGTKDTILRLHYSSTAGCGNESSNLTILSKDKMSFSNDDVAKLLNEISPADPEIFFAGKRAYIGGMPKAGLPSLLSIEDSQKHQICTLMSKTDYEVTEVFPPLSTIQ